MRTRLTLVGLLVVLIAASVSAQTPPRLVRFAGAVRPVEGPVQTGPAVVTLGIYADSDGGAALWSETQAVLLDASGQFAAVLGSTLPDGVPLELFATGAARWLEIGGDGWSPQPRVMLLSVPYALKAADADTVGGKPLSAFVLTGDTSGVGADGLTYVDKRVLTSGLATSGAAPGGAGTANYIGMFSDTTTLVNSVMYQSGTSIGVNTAAPAAAFHAVSAVSPGSVLRCLHEHARRAAGRVPRRARDARIPDGAADQRHPGRTGRARLRGDGWSSGRGQVMYKAAEPGRTPRRGRICSSRAPRPAR